MVIFSNLYFGPGKGPDFTFFSTISFDLKFCIFILGRGRGVGRGVGPLPGP